MGRQNAARTTQTQQLDDEPLGVIGKLLAIFTNHNDPEREKKRQLKALRRDLNRSRHKFYKPRGNEVQPALGRFFFDIYKAVVPAQAILQNAAESKALKSLVIEYYMSAEQAEMRERFTEERVRAAAEKKDTRALAGELKQAMVNFFGSFDNTTVKRINATYNTVLCFIRFVGFDYYFLLKKFDSGVPEGDTSYKPKFEVIGGEYISDDLKDFLEVAPLVDKSQDWDTVFAVLQQYRGVEVISRAAWKKVMNSVTDVLTTDVLAKIVRYVEQDPYCEIKPSFPSEHIVEIYLNTLKTTTEATIQKILAERRGRKVQELCTRVFGTTTIARTKYYTEAGSQVYTKRLLSGFTLIAPLNYLKAFLVDYFKKDVRELVRDILLVRGKWSTNMTSHQLSEAFHQVMSVAEELVKFDESLADDGERGAKLRKALGRAVGRDKKTLALLRDQLGEVNETARKMIVEAAQNLITIAKILKLAIEDAERENHEVILNWRELDGYTEQPTKQRLAEIYRQIHYFVQLMQVYVKSK